ncbi:MAG TPA: FtsQ-type POTRA domain-containing protein [Holophaga sp.]|nr:FtsQ-type POTRA domain-containing protein [Holophaga sp.]
MPWVRVSLVACVVLGAGYAALELSQRYLGLQKLVIEQVNVSGCRNERQVEIQRVADELCKGKPLFWFDAEELRQRIEERRWVKSLLIRRDPPDRLSLVVEERKPLLWLAKDTGVFLLSDDGIVLDRVNQGNLLPIPVVADPDSQTDAALLQLIRAAARLRDHQPEFFDRLTELRWSERGPVAYLEGLGAPLYLSRLDATLNIPNFQMLFLNELSRRPDVDRIRYFDLRWENEVAVGEPQTDTPPQGRSGPE